MTTTEEVKKFTKTVKKVLKGIIKSKHLDYGNDEVSVNTDADDLDNCEIVQEFIIEAPNHMTLVYEDSDIHTKSYKELIKMNEEDISKDIWNTIRKSLKDDAVNEYDEITRLAKTEAEPSNVFKTGLDVNDFIDGQKDDLHFFEALALDLNPDQYQAALAIRNCEYYLNGYVSYNLSSKFKEFVEKFKKETGIDPDDDNIISDIL